MIFGFYDLEVSKKDKFIYVVSNCAYFFHLIKIYCDESKSNHNNLMHNSEVDLLAYS